jgi:hypothetical protein
MISRPTDSQHTMRPPRPPPDARTILVSVPSPVARSGIPELCARLRFALETNPASLVICDATGIDEPDVPTVEALARLQLTAMRLGCGFLLRDPRVELTDLLDLTGLAGVIRAEDRLSLEPRRKAEHREQPGGVQEERDP